MSVPIWQSNRVSSYLLEQKLRRREKFPFVPMSPCFVPGRVRVDGVHDRHDESVCREGVSTRRWPRSAAQAQGVRVTTNMTVFTPDSPSAVRQVLDFLNHELRVDQMMILPACAYQKVPDQEHFLGVRRWGIPSSSL
jgi:hypothetical protein